MTEKPSCIFKSEGDRLGRPCWGEIDMLDTESKGDPIYVCEGHFLWSLETEATED